VSHPLTQTAKVGLSGSLGDSILSESNLVKSRAGILLALFEAMQSGRPVVVTDLGGNAGWIEDGQTGFSAKAPTPKSFDTALNRAWQAQNDWEQIGIKDHGYATAKLDYSPNKSLLKLILDAVKS
jgi:glycosyltransferase involved in cell wall biosynthesis